MSNRDQTSAFNLQARTFGAFCVRSQYERFRKQRPIHVMKVVCQTCSLHLAVTDTRMLQHWIARTTGAVSDRWQSRIGKPHTHVCPRCDSYSLGAEHLTGLAFYSPMVCAVLTVHDCDWWSADSIECNTEHWPKSGHLTFSEAALRSTVEFLRVAHPEILEAIANSLLLDAKSLIAAGIPRGKRAEAEWAELHSGLHPRTQSEFGATELDAAVKLMAGMLVAQKS